MLSPSGLSAGAGYPGNAKLDIADTELGLVSALISMNGRSAGCPPSREKGEQDERYIAARLSALLRSRSMCAPALCGGCREAGAGCRKQEESAPVSLTFDTLEQTVRENNPCPSGSCDNTVKSEEEADS